MFNGLNIVKGLEVIKQDILEKQELEVTDIDFPEYRGTTFPEFWAALPHKLEFTDYEDALYKALESGENNKIIKAKQIYRKIRIKKATGLGITEFMTRYVSWKCLKDNEWKDQQLDVSVIVITGARQELTNQIIGRIKGLFKTKFKTKESVIILNGCKIEAFPTNNLAAARGLNPRLVWLDEADFFPLRHQDEARTVGERYRAKGNALLVLISTTNMPGGLYERMDEETDEKNGYLTFELNYEYGVGIVYDPEIIEQEKLNNPSFEREYNLKYGYGLGDIFEGIDNIIQEYDLNLLGGQRGCYGDPAFGSSKFGVLGAEVREGKIYITEANEFPRASPSAMLDVVADMAERYNHNCKIDAAHPGFIRDLEERGIPALPINFGLQIRDYETANKQSLRSKMTINASMMVKNGLVIIHPSHSKLLSQLRAAHFDKTGGVDKEELNFDVGDCFLMACWDLKEFDYGHYDIMGNKFISKKQDDTDIKKSGGISMSVDNFE